MTDDTIEDPAAPEPLRKSNLLGTGSTLLNLACSGSHAGGFLKGKYYFIVGDSTSGKTFLSMTCFAEATINKRFSGYRFIYDNGEDGMLMDLDTLFNETVADKVEPPAMNGDDPVYSSTIEEFYYNLDDAIKQGTPFIYVLDSMDSLDSVAANAKFDQHKKAHRKRTGAAVAVAGEEESNEDKKALKGSYGDGKAKKNSEFLRKAMKGLRATGSILIILSQTRDDIGSMFGGKTRSGGRALRFYATIEIWSSVVGPIKKKVNDKERKVGTRVKLAVRKNRITGKLADFEIDIYPSFGIDDIGTCVDYLVDEGFWDVDKQTIRCKGLDAVAGTRDKIIRIIEKRGLEDDVRRLCGECWQIVDDACALKRKNRYADADEDTI